MSDPLARFEAERGHLTGLAYRMLGEMTLAEDVVQEAWLRWQGADHAAIRQPAAFLSTVTMRLCLDALRAAKARRETYVGPWLPEPISPDDARAFAPAPDAAAELASDLSLALLHLLERLSPEERAAFILHDAFDCEYAMIAATLGKTETACRKLVSRARERVREGRPRFAVDRREHRALMERFLEASNMGDARNVLALLSPGAVALTDGGGKAVAALRPIVGADKVARFIAGIARKGWPLLTAHWVGMEDGEPTLLLHHGGVAYLSLQIDSEDGRITRLYMTRNPDKLRRLAAAVGADCGREFQRHYT